MVRGVAGRPQQQVDLVVAVRRVVMEQREALHARFLRDVHRVVHRAVTPVALVLELRRRVLRVVDQQIDAVAELEDILGDVLVGVRVATDLASTGCTHPATLTVVGEVRDRDAVPIEPVTERRSDVADPAGPHLRGGRHREVVLTDIVEPHFALELLRRDREVRRLHHPGEDLADRAFLLARAVHVERVAAAVERHEERESLDVVPVEMAQQDGAVEVQVLERSVGEEPQTEIAQARSEVEDDRCLALDLDRDTGGVPAVAGQLRAVARCRTAHAVKGDFHAPRHWTGRIPTFSARKHPPRSADPFPA